MNVLFICDEYPPGKNGGIGTVVQVLGRELARQGHGVFVAGLYAYSYGQKDFEEDRGVKVWRLRYGLNIKARSESIIHKLINKIPGAIRQHLNGRQAFAAYIDFINALVEKEKIDIIEIPDWNTFAMRIGFTVQWPAFKAPLLLKSHGSYTKICHDTGKTPKKNLQAIDQLLYDRADALSAVSNDTAATNKKLFHVTKPVKTLYNGIEAPTASEHVKRSDRKAIYTGTLIAAKGIFQLVKAWNLVLQKHPDARLDVYGKGETRPLLKLLGANAATVAFNGHVSRSELFTALASATMAVFPSYSESFALAPMEAMAVGCPVIYTSRSSGKELITDGDNGGLADPEDVEGISKKIIELLENKTLQEQYAERGKKTIYERFSISKIAKEHIDYYTEVITIFKS